MSRLTLAVFLLFSCVAYAQTAPSQAEMDALRARVEALERANAEQAPQQNNDALNRELETLGAINAARPIGQPAIFPPPRW